MASKKSKQPKKSSKASRKPAPRRASPARKASPAARAAAPAKGLISIAPGLTVNDLQKSMAWYRDVLGCTLGQKWEMDGQLRGVEMKLGAVAFNLGQDDWKLGRDRVKGQGVRLYVTTGSDIDKVANGIKSRGGTLASEPKDEWGMRTFSIDDPDGYKMTFFYMAPKT